MEDLAAQASSVDLRTDRGHLTMREVAPGVVLTTFSGHGTMPVADALMEGFDGALARHGTIVIFDDWEAAQGYDSEVRLRLTDWTKKHFDSIRSTTVLVRSKILAMGLSVANLALRRPVTVTNDRKSFERALMLARSEARSRQRVSPAVE